MQYTRTKRTFCRLQGIWVLALCSASACMAQPFTFVGNGNTVVDQASETLPSSTVDILFVVDNSGSMADKQATLRNSAEAFVAELAKTNVNYHLGVVTTDLYAPTDGGRLRMGVPGPQFLTAPGPLDPQAAQKRAALVASFNATVSQLGIGGSSQEAGLGAVTMALNPADPSIKALNQGFMRSEADLAVVIVTDEDDCTPLPENFSTVGAWHEPALCYNSPQYLQQVNTILDQFAALKGDVSRVRVALITGGKKAADGSFSPAGCNVGADGQADTACGCWYYAADAWFCNDLNVSFAQACSQIGVCSAENCPSNLSTGVCDTPRCKTTAPHRYMAFLDKLAQRRQAVGHPAGTFVDTICQSDYRTALLSVAHSVVVSNCFTLTPGVPTDTLSLTLSHQLPDGTYSPSGVVQRFDPSAGVGTCQSCGNCQNDAWQLVTGANGVKQMCLACGLQALPGDNFKVSQLQAPAH
jgi:hypothetical protein